MPSLKTIQNKIGITLGDPAGIGPEITFKAIESLPLAVKDKIHLIGAASSMKNAAKWLGKSVTHLFTKTLIEEPANGFPFGSPSLESGLIQAKSLDEAVHLIKEGSLVGLVTAPINKQCIKSAGFHFPGHTEYLAHNFGDVPVAMSFLGGSLRAALVTTHVPLESVSSKVSSDRIIEVTKLAIEGIKGSYPMNSIGVLGLNPHAGEEGLFGLEEIEKITPAINALRKMYPDIRFIGPLPPDSAFRTKCDFFIAMYHDQALIPIKLVDFEKSVNVTLGLPFPRTSPDHGVAYDIAGKGIANFASMRAAIDACLKLSKTA